MSNSHWKEKNRSQPVFVILRATRKEPRPSRSLPGLWLPRYISGIFWLYQHLNSSFSVSHTKAGLYFKPSFSFLIHRCHKSFDPSLNTPRVHQRKLLECLLTPPAPTVQPSRCWDLIQSSVFQWNPPRLLNLKFLTLTLEPDNLIDYLHRTDLQFLLFKMYLYFS